MPFLDVKRSEASEAGLDSFAVTVKEKKVYKTIGERGTTAKSCKNFFSQRIQGVQFSSYVGPVFRFRYERVGNNIKVQKPYVHALTTIELSKGKPVKARAACNCEIHLTLCFILYCF